MEQGTTANARTNIAQKLDYSQIHEDGFNRLKGEIVDGQHSYVSIRLSELSMELDHIGIVDLRLGDFDIILQTNPVEDISVVDNNQASGTAGHNVRSTLPYTISEVAVFRRYHEIKQGAEMM